MATLTKVNTKAKAKTDQHNDRGIKTKILVNRSLIYIYPEDADDPLKRKAFRQKVRNHIRNLELAIAKSKGKDNKSIKALNSYLKKHTC